jgi:hypothetical protein
MTTVSVLLLLSGLYPLIRAWQANRTTSLRATLLWAGASWAAWFWALLDRTASMETVRYIALCLTGCTAVAVLGARRPGVASWNFVVLGLLAVLLLPLGENLLLGGEQHRGGVRAWFLAGTLAVGLLNYLPTRLGPAALLLGLGCGSELAALLFAEAAMDWAVRVRPVSDALLAAVPWVALLAQYRPPPDNEFDQLWRDFRDRFGMVWALRLRDQFNRAAEHAGWSVALSWRGLWPIAAAPDPTELAAMTATLQALLRRFGPASDQPVT